MFAAAAAVFLLLSATPAYSVQVPTLNQTVQKHNARVLVFQAVKSTDNVAKLVKSNIDRLRLADVNFDLILAHYDEKQEDFTKRVGEKWYSENVKHSMNAPGYKMHLLKKFIKEHKAESLNDYTWVWPIDEDMDISATNPKRLLLQARHSSALIVASSYQQMAPQVAEDSAEEHLLDERARGEDEHYYPMNKPHPECRFRYSPMVSLEMPLIKPEVMLALSHCETCMSPGEEDTDFGVERMLCSWASEKFDRWSTKTCAILDMQMVVHRNWQTGAPKERTHGWSYVQQHNEKHYIDKATAQAASSPGYDCVKEPRMYEHRSVYCGAHRATTCNECPQNHGRTWCNGQCEWSQGEGTCIRKGSDKMGQ